MRYLHEEKSSAGDDDLGVYLNRVVCVTLHTLLAQFLCDTSSPAFLSSRSLVVKGVDLASGRPIDLAAKITLSRFAPLFQTEVSVLKRLQCESIPPIIKTWAFIDGSCAFTMPWYSVCLFDLVSTHRVTALLAWRVVSAVSRAYMKAHSLGITHCDLKPENVFMDDVQGRGCVLGDWDLACDNMQDEMASCKTGTAEFNPPAAHGLSLVSPEADAFRLGSLMYTMLFGKFPLWSSEGILTTLVDVGSSKITIHPDLPRNFMSGIYEAILLRLMRQADLPTILLQDVFLESLGTTGEIELV